MHRTRFICLIVLAWVVPTTEANMCAAQNPSVAPLTLPDSSSTATAIPARQIADASLKVRLRLEDESTFLGGAEVRLMPNEGYEVVGKSTETAGETLFPGLSAGTYIVEVRSPGYLALRMHTQIEAGHLQRIIYVVMKPKPIAKEVSDPSEGRNAVTLPVEATTLRGTPPLATTPENNVWVDHVLETNAPPVDPNVECPTPQVLHGVALKMEEFVQNLEKFSANEELQHYRIEFGKERGQPETRRFTYVVTVARDRSGTFMLEEYRNGSVDPAQFPDNVATHGLPALDLLFHPLLAEDFTFVCEGLGQSDGKPSWQVHFAQRTDRPVRIRSYRIGGANFSVYLEGRAWIDPGNFQVERIESELERPIPEIELKHEYILIKYAPVQFNSLKLQIWLPQEADLYVKRKGHQYHRRHIFTDFRAFNVETAQNIQAPKGAYTFINSSDHEIAGVLTVVPRESAKLETVSVNVRIPARGKVFKVVGPGKDINLSLTMVATATFAHNGSSDAVRVEADLGTETTLDVIPEAWVTQNSGPN